MRLLINSVIHHTSKKRNLGSDFVFVYTKHERLPFLLSFVKRDEDFEILRIWQNVALYVYGPIRLDYFDI